MAASAAAAKILRALTALHSATSGKEGGEGKTPLIAAVAVIASVIILAAAIVSSPLMLALEGGGEPVEIIRSESGMVHPCPSAVYVSSEFGMRFHPIQYVWKLHSGIDLAADGGSPILAAMDGTITLSRWYGGYGNCIIIDHGDGLETLYAHMMAPGLPAGLEVRAGDIIGYVGTTGNSTGNHLHFEVIVGGQRVNPRLYIDF